MIGPLTDKAESHDGSCHPMIDVERLDSSNTLRAMSTEFKFDKSSRTEKLPARRPQGMVASAILFGANMRTGLRLKPIVKTSETSMHNLVDKSNAAKPVAISIPRDAILADEPSEPEAVKD